MLERILVPLDGSEIAEAILAQVIRLLRIQDASVTLFRAVPIPAQSGLEGAPFGFADLKSEAEKYISALESDLLKEGVKVQGIVRVCGEVSGILEAARQHSSTLIAMATHGRTGLSRFVFGSVTEGVLRACDIPVLVVRSFQEVAASAIRTPAREVPIRRILMPVDDTKDSLAVLPHVRALARAVGASVMVLGVVEPVGRKSQGGSDPLVRIAVNELTRNDIAVDPLVRLGDPASEILDACRTHDADLVAMTTHGRRGLSRLVMGSVTEKVLRASTVPVLVVHGKRAGRLEDEKRREERSDSPAQRPARH
ncbi:MAG: UspA domain-containing [Planctomycetota bacterium]|nr:MAG: UspA domain-containing [Planctomycetota bacterium]